MDIPLHFGTGVIHLQIPKGNVSAVLRPRQIESDSSNVDSVSHAIEAARKCSPLPFQGRTVGVLLPDGTRDMPAGEILPLLLAYFNEARKLVFFICTGSHTPYTAANTHIINGIKARVSEAGLKPCEIVVHDCCRSDYSKAGVTGSGTEVWYNKRLEEVDVYCILSDIKHHYFAGYSNPVKNIVPGLCAFKTIERNHSLTFDERSCAGCHPWHPDAARRDNPLANDLLEAMQLIVQDRPVWALITIACEGTLQWAGFGPAKEITARAFQKADEWNMHIVDMADYMIVSPGGLPNDVDLYIAQRALELTHSVVNDGGQILFTAGCPDGIGSELTKEHFEKRLTKSHVQILQQKPHEYHLFEHKPYRLARLIQRLEKLWFYTEIKPHIVKKIHMCPCNNLQDVVTEWLDKRPDSKILIADGANKMLLRPRT